MIKVEREGRVVAVRPAIVPPGQIKETNGEITEIILPSSNGVTKSVEACVVSHRMEHFTRPPTSSGGRNMQDTTFSLSAEYPSKNFHTSNYYFVCFYFQNHEETKRNKCKTTKL